MCTGCLEQFRWMNGIVYFFSRYLNKTFLLIIFLLLFAQALTYLSAIHCYSGMCVCVWRHDGVGSLVQFQWNVCRFDNVECCSQLTSMYSVHTVLYIISTCIQIRSVTPLQFPFFSFNFMFAFCFSPLYPPPSLCVSCSLHWSLAMNQIKNQQVGKYDDASAQCTCCSRCTFKPGVIGFVFFYFAELSQNFPFFSNHQASSLVIHTDGRAHALKSGWWKMRRMALNATGCHAKYSCFSFILLHSVDSQVFFRFFNTVMEQYPFNRLNSSF